ncbi:MAG: zinc-ribbon domain-containing protein, partial [Promethearchaeota archaeon]
DCFYILACLMIGSGVPDQLISRGIVFSPGQIPITASGTYPATEEKLKTEFDYAAPPVPEPSPTPVYESTPTIEPEPEFEFEAPPVPEPINIQHQEPNPIDEPEFEPEIPLPESQIEESVKQPAQFDFKTPEEILSQEEPDQQQFTPSQPTSFTGEEETYKPKVVPFTHNIPVPAPPPEQFQSFQEISSTQNSPPNLVSSLTSTGSSTPKSESLMDYLPEPIYSKKDKKRLEKQKKKEEKEKKLQEEKERQEKLLEEMKHVKKEKKEKPKKEKKEKDESKQTKSPVSRQPVPEKDTTSVPSLFQTLSQKVDSTEKALAESFVPFRAEKESQSQETSKLRIIPNVSDLETKQTISSFNQKATPVQPSVSKSSGKEMTICKQCGATLSSDYAFCNKCGAKL